MFKEGYGFGLSVIGICGDCGGEPEITTHCTGDVVVVCKGCGLKRVYTSFQHALIGWNSIGRRPEWEFGYLKEWEFRLNVSNYENVTYTWTKGSVRIELCINKSTDVAIVKVQKVHGFSPGMVLGIEAIPGKDFSYSKFDGFIRESLSVVKPLIDIYEYVSCEDCTL